MALNNFKCMANCLTPLHFKGLKGLHPSYTSKFTIVDYYFIISALWRGVVWTTARTLSLLMYCVAVLSHCQNPVSMSVDADIQREHAYQREHLESTVSALKKRLASDNQHHHDDNVRIMQVSCCHAHSQ